MISITAATTDDAQTIINIGRVSVEEAHRDSCSADDLNQFIDRNYNMEAIRGELMNERNSYYIIRFDGVPVGFSKIILNSPHSNIRDENVTKLDRIYLLSQYFDKKLGLELLKFNIEVAKKNNQAGIWLFTWVGNSRAIRFYQKTGFAIVGSYQFPVTESRSNLNHQMLLRIT